jgi:hypothetical protein
MNVRFADVLNRTEVWQFYSTGEEILLLAEMIPPLSSPEGGTRLDIFAERPNNPYTHRGKDLKDYVIPSLWDSANRPGKSGSQRTQKRWLHGDYKDAPYRLTYKLYQQIKGITQGEQQ